MSTFKESFKYYKAQKPLPDLSNVLDFNRIPGQSLKVRKRFPYETGPKHFFGMKSSAEWDIYELTDHPGLWFIKNPFTNIGQRYWIMRCLKYYTKKPNRTNMSIDSEVADNEDWWEYARNNIDKLNKMFWVTLGYHYNWELKSYSEESRTGFPKDLALLTNHIASVLHFHTFKAEAAIVNFYSMKSCLNGHVDYAEVNLEAPLVSISFGQTALFLIGGKTLDDEPTPLFIRNGDIVVMSKESRLCYHGVPRILSTTNLSCNVDENENTDSDLPEGFDDIYDDCKNPVSWEPFRRIIESIRININVRQVLKDGHQRLNR